MRTVIHLSPAVFLVAALLVAWTTRIAPWRSWRNYGVLSIAAAIVAVQTYAVVLDDLDILLFAMPLAAILALYFICLLIWKPAVVPFPTIPQCIVSLLFALAVFLLPRLPEFIGYLKRNPPAVCHPADRAYVPLPAEILGLQIAPDGDVENTVRREVSVNIDYQMRGVGLLKDKAPRKIDGPVFAAVSREYTEKTKQTVSIEADTRVMSLSDEKTVMGTARKIASEIQRVRGLQMQHGLFHSSSDIYASISRSPRESIPLYTGGDDNCFARVLWVKLDNDRGFLRMLLQDTCRFREKSPLYLEAQANQLLKGADKTK